MIDRYKIYVASYKGYELLDIVYDLSDVNYIIDNLDSNKYISYLVVKHKIKSNSDEVIDFGYTDYNIRKKAKVSNNERR